MTPTTSQTSWPTTTASLCELLNIDTDVKKCHASTQKKARCQHPVSKANSAHIACLLEKAVAQGSFSAAQATLQEVSYLIMCCRSQSSPSTPAKPSPKLLLPKLPSPKSPKSPHEFEDFSRPRSTLEINKAIKKRLLEPLTETETKNGGYIYLYTFPESYHDAHPYIKIGYSQDVSKRMRDWKKQCGYEAKVLGEFPAEHYVKVERIVHAQLWNQRKREKACPACNVRHEEWFKVEAMTASKIIALWTGWMRREPYDGEVNILDKWRIRIEGLDMANPDCWDLLVKGLFDDDDVEESELSEGDSFAWSSDEQSEISEEDALGGYDTENPEFTLTDDESDDGAYVEDDER
ncbi:hypothetical protein FVER53590_02733 [Fusarium verticillioides]|nr:hypothetical protein FVER53590_02733 [Fusarium verticillioides]